MRRLLAVLTLAAVLAACETPAPPPYGPAAGPAGYGYAQTKIEADRFRIVYRAPGPAERASDLALLRAAEVTLANGYDWFIVTQRDLQPIGGYNDGGPRIGIGVGGASFGHHTSVGVGTGVGFNLGPGGYGRGAQVTLEISLRHGQKPAGDANAYDARDVQRSVRPGG